MMRQILYHRMLWGATVLILIGLPAYLAAQSEDLSKSQKDLGKLTTLIHSVQKKSAELDQRAKDLELKEERLRILESDVKVLVDKYAKLRKEMEQKLRERSEEQDKQIARLAKMLAAMPPQKAVSQMEHMDEAVVLDLLAKIKEKKAALILSEMDPAMAAALSEKLVLKSP